MIAFALVLLPFSPWYVGGLNFRWGTELFRFINCWTLRERKQTPTQGSISTYEQTYQVTSGESDRVTETVLFWDSPS